MSAGRLLAGVLRYPPTWLAMAVLVGLEWAFFRWFAPAWLMGAAALGLGAVLALAWPLILARSRPFAVRLVRMPAELDREQRERLERLHAELEQLGAGQGLEQLRLLRQKIDNVGQVLRHRLDQGEVTYARYLGTAEQVYLAALDNLHEVVVALTSIGSIDPAYLQTRTDALEAKRERLPGEDRELETLYQRRALLVQQQHKVSELLGENERAMTVLDNTATALAGTRTRAGHAALSAQDAIAELEQLASRIGRYASGG